MFQLFVDCHCQLGGTYWLSACYRTYCIMRRCLLKYFGAIIINYRPVDKNYTDIFFFNLFGLQLL